MTKKRPKVFRIVGEVFTHNIGLKLLSIAAAIGLFSIVHGAEDDERSYFVELDEQLPPPSSGRMLVSELPDKVKVTVRGSRSIVSSVTAEDLGPVTMDLRDTERSYYYFDPDSFDLPASVRLVQLAPASIPLTWAKRVDRRIPVEVRLSGRPGPGLEARPVRVEPATVPAAGPESEIEPLDVIETQRIDVRGLDPGEHTRRVALEEPPPHTVLGVDAVDAVIRVATQQSQRELGGLEVVPVGEGRVKVRPARVDVTLWGSAASLQGLDPDRIVPQVDVPQPLSPGEAAKEVRVELRGVPDGVDGRVVPYTVLVEAQEPEPGRASGGARSGPD